MMRKHWLVEIRLKDWEPTLSNGSRTVAYEEVEALDEYDARHKGFDRFEARCNYEPTMRRMMLANGITQYNCCAAEAVQV